ncbi:PKD domain-containing protein [Roseivirga echinicomitans]|uniref:PKD domain-containing protein n=1 Tax=Roseivirga echinicomitans TaxID=296218 RepID=A0A150X209_9BACT|nr:PKD domain-containing protein [Roseivirga echinicomitans]KYG72763.1 hypothetical protein AWN68_08645 [Roseivirga echinicomitans]
MKLNQRTKSYRAGLSGLITILFLVFITISCDEELPGEGSIIDLTPASADFSFSPSDGDYKEILFSNLSVSASGYAWDFGDGSTTTEKNPTHIFAAVGSYSVKLTASDNNGLTSDFTTTVEVVEPINDFEPVILNPGFDIQGSDDYRDNWTNPNGDRSKLLQITTSPVHSGAKAAKLPADGSREIIQVITVERNSDYILSFYYTLKTSPAGFVTMAILASDGTTEIVSESFNDQTDASSYVLASMSFNSGDNTQIVIYGTNQGAEARVDSFTIVND